MSDEHATGVARGALGRDAHFVVGGPLDTPVFRSARHSLAWHLGLPDVDGLDRLERSGELAAMITKRSQARRGYERAYARTKAELRFAARQVVERAAVGGNMAAARRYLEGRRRP